MTLVPNEIWAAFSKFKEDWEARFDFHKQDWETRFASHKNEMVAILDRHHAENRLRLQNIDKQSTENGQDLAQIAVKIGRLYGEDGQPGAVDRLAAKVESLGNKVMYASGFVAAVVILVGWYIEHGK